jgi:hypothetical protein
MSKYLCIYAYYEKESARKNLEFFQRHGMSVRSNVTYILIINGEVCTLDTTMWDVVIKRENRGYDFGAWYHGLQNSNLNFDYFIFLNDSIRGPFGDPNWIHTFTNLLTDHNKLAGITINCHTNGYNMAYRMPVTPHVQSMLLCTDRVGLNIIYPNIINNNHDLSLLETVILKEIGASLAILRAGYNITAILKPFQVDYQIIANCYVNAYNGAKGDPWWNNAYFGRSLDPFEVIFFKTNRGVTEDVLEQATIKMNNGV